jgi:uncharacterized membrane protein
MRRLAWVALFLLCLAVSAYSAVAYGIIPLASLPLHPDLKASFAANAWGLRLHIFASIAALALGPLQFSTRLRARRPALHRWTGRIYLGIGVAVGGASGLYMAQHAFGGLVPRVGFTLLALAWLYTGLKGYLAIRRRDVASHREWMLRNFALTLAAVTLRIYLPASMASGFAFEASYPVIAWLAWAPNLAVAECWIRSRRAQAAGTRGAPMPAPAL